MFSTLYKNSNALPSFSAKPTIAMSGAPHSSASSELSAAPLSHVPVLLCVGDSLTQFADTVSLGEDGPGWLTLLRGSLHNRAHVLNCGVSGYNTKWSQPILTSVLTDHPSSDVVMLFFGANDAAMPPLKQHVPIDRYAANLCDMVRKVRTAGMKPLLVAPPALDDEARARSVEGRPERSAAVTKEYADRCVKVALELGVPCLNICAEMEQRAVDGRVVHYLSDGLHFNTEGNRLVKELLVQTIDAHFPEVSPATLGPPFPPWDYLD